MSCPRKSSLLSRWLTHCHQVFDNLAQVNSSEKEMLTIIELVGQSELEESQITNHNLHHDEEALVFKFRKLFQQQ
jgi:hypothetical protein